MGRYIWYGPDRLGRRRGAPLSVEELAHSLNLKYRRCTWREGTRKSLSSRFALERIVPFHDDGVPPSLREDVLVLMEWEDHESAPTKFYFVNINPDRQLTTKQLVRILKQRWRTERVYEDLKGELGFDHYEGRRFPGWHHHVSVALACFSVIVAERGRRFPRLAISRVAASWLPRCPCCHHNATVAARAHGPRSTQARTPLRYPQ